MNFIYFIFFIVGKYKMVALVMNSYLRTDTVVIKTNSHYSLTKKDKVKIYKQKHAQKRKKTINKSSLKLKS